jgi:hypothetical protein
MGMSSRSRGGTYDHPFTLRGAMSLREASDAAAVGRAFTFGAMSPGAVPDVGLAATIIADNPMFAQQSAARAASRGGSFQPHKSAAASATDTGAPSAAATVVEPDLAAGHAALAQEQQAHASASAAPAAPSAAAVSASLTQLLQSSATSPASFITRSTDDDENNSDAEARACADVGAAAARAIAAGSPVDDYTSNSDVDAACRRASVGRLLRQTEARRGAVRVASMRHSGERGTSAGKGGRADSPTVESRDPTGDRASPVAPGLSFGAASTAADTQRRVQAQMAERARAVADESRQERQAEARAHLLAGFAAARPSVAGARHGSKHGSRKSLRASLNTDLGAGGAAADDRDGDSDAEAAAEARRRAAAQPSGRYKPGSGTYAALLRTPRGPPSGPASSASASDSGSQPLSRSVSPNSVVPGPPGAAGPGPGRASREASEPKASAEVARAEAFV